MSFHLTTKFDDSFKWNGNIYNVDMSFNNILNLFEMFDDDLVMKCDKPFLAIKMLVFEDVEFSSYEEMSELFTYLMSEFLDIDMKRDSDSDSNGVKVYDFKKDAEIIYASFYAEYKIDLLEMHDKLHWKKFMALLSNLDDESKFKQVLGIRTMKIPSTDESSQEYRDHIIKMKEVYSLDERSKEERIDDTLNDFANILKLNSTNK